MYRFPLIELTVYVDDTSLESSGSADTVARTIAGATWLFTTALQAMGMEFSDTKNTVVASSPAIADRIINGLPNLKTTTATKAKSLGGAISNGKVRNTAVMKKRLKAFRERKVRFQKLRRAKGFSASATVLRSGGIASMVYGQGNTGVANSTLHTQRQSAAAAVSRRGAGDLDLTLMMADASFSGMADPAFAAHLSTIGLWAEAVWESWMPRSALQRMVEAAKTRAAGSKASMWSTVTGPAAAFVASASRLGWAITDATKIVTREKVELDLCRDSPAMVKYHTKRAVWQWRWGRLESKLPSLKQGEGGHGLHVQPLFSLLKSKRASENWDRQQRGALISSVINRQWTQARLFSAGMADNMACRLCVAKGLCSPDSQDPRFRGTAVHRLFTCGATKEYRCKHCPPKLLEEALREIKADGTMAPAANLLYTRALMASLVPSLPPVPPEPTFNWLVKPIRDDLPSGIAYVDGSLLDGHHSLAGLTPCRGWAVGIFDRGGELLASANGRPPAWAQGIHAVELWGMLMALQMTESGCPVRTDCMAVLRGLQQGQSWANAPCRIFARAWNPIASIIEGGHERVAWMPAHCSAAQVGRKVLSNGQVMTEVDRDGNAYVDSRAKRAAMRDRVPVSDRLRVQRAGAKLTAIAKWIGRCTVHANHFPMGTCDQAGKPLFCRDSEAKARKPAGTDKAKKRKAQGEVEKVPGDLSLCPRWEALRKRVLLKSSL